ncbi:protein mono-ADP-ribosyltransferase PARP4 [Salminus brasiliensis]|uniref:protein mono-ADP-ribosyltransferase PARP4 n=1 Tax=Salminus brasiliensis TaxID=930266 RepID=UPI003B82CFCC
MAVFEGCSVVLDLKKVPYKEKKRLMSAIVENGGSLSYVVNLKCSFVVTSSLEDLSSNRLRSVQKHQIPVVGLQFVWNCLEKGLLLPIEEHSLKPQPSDLTHPPPPHPGMKLSTQFPVGLKSSDQIIPCTLNKDNYQDIPAFPSCFQVAKYTIFYRAADKIWSVLELQSARGEEGQQYRIVKSVVHEMKKTAEKDKQMHSSSSEEAVEVYLIWREELFGKGFTQMQTLPPEAQKLASHGLQQLLLEEKLNCSTVSQEVGTFVELIWTEALGSLNSILMVPVTSISLNDVSRVEGLLLEAQKRQCEDEVKALLEEVNTLLPLVMVEPDSKQKLISKKLDLCQLIRDILNMSEATLGNPSPSSLGKYRALRCSIELVQPQSSEFQSVSQLLQDRPVQIQQILRVNRGAELHMFKEELGSIKPLLHSSRPSSFMGILSRGLLLPRVGVEQHGIERTDVGNLGSGIYFSDSLSTSIKYSKPSAMDGSRLLLVCDVALGQCKDLHRRDITLTSAPEGYSSVHGVRHTQKTRTDFEDDEYVVYNTDQVRLKYVVQYSLEEDQVKNFQPHVDTSVELVNPATTSELLSSDDSEDLEVTKNPLEEVTAGLLDSSGKTLPLQAVHVRCKLIDLLSQVIIFQTYTNESTVPIEAKYVFPLEETAAVCGFEAFINGKHVIGKVKEKEQARKEYRQAIEKGHGAYLMDQDAPDVFTISVGNLPPGATVLIKVTFITELVVRAGSILFSLPGSVAPWQQSAALNQRTQVSVEKVCVNELRPSGEFSLSMSIEMPYEIKDLDCSHLFEIKRTDCKAVVSTLPEQTLSTDGFQLSFTLSQIHMPRMWVEKHPEKESEACMLVFYPDFESSGVSSVSDVVILLDTSESMRGEAMLNARRIALKVLNTLDSSLRVNIISFGTDYKEAFPSANVLDNENVFTSAKKFIMSSPAVGGSTELWRPLRSLNLLPPSRGVRNVLLMSDGHVQNQPQTLQLVRENARHTRLFTCGLSPRANRHMLRALAQAGGGAYEFFDTKTKHSWAEKVNSQVKCMASPGCSSVAVKWQQFNPTAPPPVQAPSQLHALFSDCHTLVYGFVPHCTQATLLGDLSGQEIKTMVSTTELQKTKGTFLHKLTARAIIRDYEDGSLGSSEAEHEGKKAELKSYIIELSKEFSILSQFTSFVAIEERDKEQPESGITDVPKLIAEEDVDILPYMGWTEKEDRFLEDEEDFIDEALDSDSLDFSLDIPLMAASIDHQVMRATCCLRRPNIAPILAPTSDLPKPELVSSDFAFPPLSDYAAHSRPSPKSRQVRSEMTSDVPRISAACLKEEHFMPQKPDTFDSLAMKKINKLASRPASSLRGYTSSNRTVPVCADALPYPSQLIPQLNSGFASKSLASFCTSEALLSPAPPPPPPPPPPPAPTSKPIPAFYSALPHTPPPPALPSIPSSFSSGSFQPHASFQTADAAIPPPPLPSHRYRLAALCVPQSSFSQYQFAAPSTSSIAAVGPLTLLTASESAVCSEEPECLTEVPGSTLFGSISRPFAPRPTSVIVSAGSPTHPAAESEVLSQERFPHGPVATSTAGLKLVPATSGFTLFRSNSTACGSSSFSFGSSPSSFGSSSFSFGSSPSSFVPGPSLFGSREKKSSLKHGFSFSQRLKFHVEGSEDTQLQRDSKGEQYRRPDQINWDDLFHLQHQDGYWECTGSLSRFLGLDVDFFANVFLKEKGICSLGVKAHADILKLVATMLVLQLMRVMKMVEGELFQSLFRLSNFPESKPACYEAVKKAVDWVCWADRQYPCVYSRLEFGCNWESCTRQLLGLDSLPPCSPLTPVLQRSTQVPVM